MALYHVLAFHLHTTPFALLYMVNGGHNHPLGLRVSASGAELDNMGELIGTLPSHRRPTLRRLKRGTMPSIR
jgi:hypothetical protein